MSIDLSLNETQRLIQDAARSFFERNCPTTVVRELEASEEGYSPDMWREMANLGWLGMSIPEALGGGGRSFLDMYPLYEEMGRYLVPSPHLDTVVIAGDILLRAGNDAQKEMLAAIADGRLIVSPALLEEGGSYTAAGINLAATANGESHRLNGTKLLVPYVPAAGYLLVSARTSGDHSAEGVSLFLVDPRAGGVSVTPIENIAGYALYEVTFSDVSVPAADLVGPLDGGWPIIEETLTKAAVLQAAAIVGMGERVLGIATEYASNRVQFGRPIGTNQAVQYMVTDILRDAHLGRMLAMQAAWRIDQSLPYQREASIAKAFTSKAAAHMTRQAHEVHAGVAFMNDHDMQLFSRRAKNWEYNLGDFRHHSKRVADLMF